ncbi:MAG TPA: L-seryl-tRNA(Sec) selenium transferase [Longimicrobiales bacterium]|nr:L-seryl-tRNA(Sec) selenium transferase [Longimicrobiales bacterium]
MRRHGPTRPGRCRARTRAAPRRAGAGSPVDPRRAIPAVDRLLSSEAFEPLLAGAPRRRVLAALQEVQAELRSGLAARAALPADLAEPALYARLVGERLHRRERAGLRHVVNATGVVLHTNLGRSPLAPAAIEAMVEAARSYSNLEYDLEAGTRGSRYDHCAPLLRELTGAEDALVVNNNAAALVLALSTLARGRDVVVSRGELVEIGGAFRVPEIVERSGARLVEVGATNRTHPEDYTSAVSAETGAVLKVHRSNFRVVGFTADVSVAELAVRLGGRLPIVEDLGSGLLLDLTRFGLPHEPTAAEALRAGADIVTLSGDKLLGGPQAGIVLGRRDLVEAMRRNPLCRALRVDKLTLAALEATLALYLEPDRALREIPTLRMLTADAGEIAGRARDLAARLTAAGVACSAVDGASAVGGGAFPAVELPTTLVRLDTGLSAAELDRRLRAAEPPVVARIVGDHVVLDVRTVQAGEEPELLAGVCGALA